MANTLQRVLSLFRVNNTLETVVTAEGTLDVPSMGQLGDVLVQNLINGTSSPNLMQGAGNDVDNVASTTRTPTQPAPIAAVAYTYGYDSVGDNWDRARVAGNNADGVAPEALGILKQAAALYGFNGTTFDRLLSQANNGDAVAVSTLGVLKQVAFQYTFNETSFDRVRGNTNIVMLPNAVRSASVNSADFVNYNGRGLLIIFQIFAVPGVSSIALNIQRKHPDGGYSNVLTGVAQTSVTTVQMRVYPGITAAANTAASDVLSREFRVEITQVGAGNFTYSVEGCVLV